MGTVTFDGIGTKWRMDIYDALPEKKLGYLKTVIEKRIEQFERMYSRFRYDSFTNITLNQRGTFTLPSDAEPLFSLYHKLFRITDGAFTPFIGQVLVDAGYDAEYSFKKNALHTPPTWDEVLDYHFPTVRIKKPQVFDFGAGGKGYLIDIVGEVLKEHGIEQFCIDAGGDILYKSAQPMRVGLENPNNLEEAIGVATITDTSLCASAGSRRKWGEFHHIIDPRTLSSPEKIVAAWTTAATTLVADAIATCLFLVPAKQLTPHYSFEHLTLFADNSFEKSSGFPAELFIK